MHNQDHTDSHAHGRKRHAQEYEYYGRYDNKNPAPQASLLALPPLSPLYVLYDPLLVFPNLLRSALDTSSAFMAEAFPAYGLMTIPALVH